MSSSVSMLEALDALELPVPGRLPGHIECPLPGHLDKTASCYIQSHFFRCFGCGAGGDAIDLVRGVTGATFFQAKQFLGGLLDELHDRPEVHRPERELLDLGEVMHLATVNTTVGQYREAKDFATEKWPHLSFSQLQDWGVRVGAYTLLLPHTDADGVIRGIKTRTFAGGNKGRKLSYPGSVFTTRLYRVKDVPPGHHISTILVEGESDTWTLTTAYSWNRRFQIFGLPAGAQCWKPEFKAEILAASPGSVYVGLDNDETGDTAAKRIIEDLGSVAMRLRPPAPHKDWTDAYLAGWRP